MGEAKQNKRKHLAVLQNTPNCIYCGGKAPAVAVDHMPPRICFRWKWRPKGLEFPSCRRCNEGASHADLVAGMLSRLYCANEHQEDAQEVGKIFRSVQSNIPGLLEELKKPRGAEKIALNKLPISLRNGGVLNVSGPILDRYIEVFCLKLGLALHYENTREVLNSEGGIATRWYTNFDLFTGTFPESLKELFPAPKTLKQGIKHVSDQFQFASLCAEDNSFGAYFASFRLSFSVVAFVARHRSILDDPHGKIPVRSPNDLKRLIEEIAKEKSAL